MKLHFFLALTLAAAPLLRAQTYNWGTIAGSYQSPGSVDGTNGGAAFRNPQGIAVDGKGALYVGDAGNYTVRKVVPSGANWITTTIAGKPGFSGTVDGANSSARFSSVGILVQDKSGNLYVPDNINNTIRKLTPSGTNWVVSSIAGLGADGLAVNANGNLFTSYNCTIRKLSLTGGAWVPSTLAGSAGVAGAADGTNSAARFSPNAPVFAVDGDGALYVLDGGGIRKVAPVGADWVVTTIPVAPGNWAVRDSAGAFYVSYYSSHTLIKLTPSGSTYTAATIGGQEHVAGETDGTNTAALFDNPAGMAIDKDGTIYVADSGNDTLRQGQLLPTGSLAVTLGPAEALTAGAQWQVDGGAWQTNGAVVTNLLTGAHSISFLTLFGWIAPSNQIVTISSNQIAAASGAYIQQFGALQVNLSPGAVVAGGAQWQLDGGAWLSGGSVVSNLSLGPHSVVFSPVAGWLAPSNQTVTVAWNQTTNLAAAYAPAYSWSTIAGLLGHPGTNDGINSAALFRNPGGIAVDGAGNVFVADVSNYTIRKVAPTGSDWVVSTIVGLAGAPGTVDGTNSDARFNSLGSLTLDGNGNLYVRDYFGSPYYATFVRELSPVGSNWVVTTLAACPGGLAVDAGGSLYTASNYTIIKLTGSGTNWSQTQLAGYPGVSGAADGTDRQARFTSPSVFGVGADGSVFAKDTTGIRKLTAYETNWVVTTIPSSLGGWPVLDGAGNMYYTSPSASNTISKLAPDGTNWVLNTVGGSPGVSGGADGVNIAAQFFNPAGVAVSPAGDLYVADGGNQTIRQGVTATPTGALQGQLGPDAILNAGAQWRVDAGAWRTNGATVTNLAAGGHIVAFAPVDGWGAPSNRVVVINPGQASSVFGAYVALGSLQVTLSPAEAVSAGALWQVDGGAWQTNGNVLPGLLPGRHTVTFSTAPGWTTPTNLSVVITSSQLTAVSGVYLQQVGALQVMLNPAGAVGAGAQWQLDGTAWQSSGTTLTNLPVGSHTVGFSAITGWTSPTNTTVSIPSNQLSRLTAVYTAKGSVVVTLSPAAAVSAGAQWQVDGGPWLNSGATVSSLDRGLHRLTFKAIDGWVAPASQSVTVLPSQMAAALGIYVGLDYTFSTIAGLADNPGSADGANHAARFYNPAGICVDSSGNLFVVDTGNSIVRRLAPAGTNWISSTIAGVAGDLGSADGANSAARFNYPSGVAVDASGVLYVADQVNSTIRTITARGTDWIVNTIAGSPGNYDANDGVGSAAAFYYPAGIAVDKTGNLYVADQVNSTIRRMAPSGANWVVTTIAGSAGKTGSADGASSAARFYWPGAVAVDAAGNVYVADTFNDTIRALTPSGTNWMVTTLAGQPGAPGSADGTNTTALFNGPAGIALDAGGNLYVADAFNNAIRKLTPISTNWVVTTIGGLTGSPGDSDGADNAAAFNNPQGLVVDGNGTLYLTDSGNGTIRRATLFGAAPAPAFAATARQTGTHLTITWSALEGRSYRAQYKTNLTQTGWLPLGAALTATNAEMSVTDPPGDGQRYYRIVLDP